MVGCFSLPFLFLSPEDAAYPILEFFWLYMTGFLFILTQPEGRIMSVSSYKMSS